jgi:hypothetical protein
MAATITVDGKVVGQRRPTVADWAVPLPPEVEEGTAPWRLRDLITRVVLAEVEAYQDRQERKRSIQALTAGEIRQGIEVGKVAPGGAEERAGEANPDEAVRVALQGFEDGLYFVFVDGEQQRRLDDPVPLHAASRVSFLRLVALAGG